MMARSWQHIPAAQGPCKCWTASTHFQAAAAAVAPRGSNGHGKLGVVEEEFVAGSDQAGMYR